MRPFMVDNYEMAHGHAAGKLAARVWGLGNCPPQTSGHNATSPRRALPQFSQISPITESHCSCFSDWSEGHVENPPGPSLLRAAAHRSGHTATLPVPRAARPQQPAAQGDVAARHREDAANSSPDTKTAPKL